MKLHDLVKHLNLLTPYRGENPDVSSIENDNRKVRTGSLFVCIKGYTVDGHDFAGAAIDNGAVALIAERPLDVGVPVIVVKDSSRAMAVLADAFYGQPSHHMHLIGITGTNGKTTTSHIIEKIAADSGKETGLIGTMYTKIGDEISESKNTTPDSLTLQKTFRAMADRGVEMAVMEVSSHALDLGRVHGCDFDVAVFTNLTQDHLDYHKSMEDYLYAKSLLFSQLGNTYEGNPAKYAILNADDSASVVYGRATAAHIVTYGIEKAADVSAKEISLSPRGTTFILSIGEKEYPVEMKLIGHFNVYNVLAAISAALVSGFPLEGIIKSVEGIEGVPGRFELVDSGQDFTIIVDYAHTPDSLENVLKTIGQFAEKEIFAIVGCGGDRDKTKRPLMAGIACDYSDKAIFTSDNPRSEDPLEILRDMEKGAKGDSYKVIPDRREAIRYAVNAALPGDIILIAGKGHETYQEVKGVIHDFDDRLEAREAVGLSQRNGG